MVVHISRAAAKIWDGVHSVNNASVIYVIFVTKQHAWSATKSFRSICFVLLAIDCFQDLTSLQIKLFCLFNYAFSVTYDKQSFWDGMTCGAAGRRRFGGIYCFHLQCRGSSQILIKEQTGSAANRLPAGT
jgi:hypothetical protein